MPVSGDWVRNFTSAPPEMLFICSGIGDSMYPTIHDRDWLIGDRSQTNPHMGDQVWAITQYGHGMVKRLRAMEGGYRLLSDNPNVPPDTATDGSMAVIGRIVGVMRRV